MNRKSTAIKTILLATLMSITCVGCGVNPTEKFEQQLKQANKEKAEALLESKIRLSCDENGQFKTLIFADVHATGSIDKSVQDNLRKLVDEEEPISLFSQGTMLCAPMKRLYVKRSILWLGT